jgi:20S proteasome alpha/beta subunit
VTLIVGLRCADGSVLMCADREQSDQGAKRSVDKIFRVRLNQGTVLVAGAGRSSIVDNALMRLERALQTPDSQRGNVLLDTHRDVIETILCEIHEEYIWGRTDENERAIRVMVAASFISGGSAPFLYGTDSDVYTRINYTAVPESARTWLTILSTSSTIITCRAKLRSCWPLSFFEK